VGDKATWPEQLAAGALSAIDRVRREPDSEVLADGMGPAQAEPVLVHALVEERFGSAPAGRRQLPVVDAQVEVLPRQAEMASV
jgi:hypothetical protein